jgi:hypothetical protein
LWCNHFHVEMHVSPLQGKQQPTDACNVP